MEDYIFNYFINYIVTEHDAEMISDLSRTFLSRIDWLMSSKTNNLNKHKKSIYRNNPISLELFKIFIASQCRLKLTKCQPGSFMPDKLLH